MAASSGKACRPFEKMCELTDQSKAAKKLPLSRMLTLARPCRCSSKVSPPGVAIFSKVPDADDYLVEVLFSIKAPSSIAQAMSNSAKRPW